MARAQIEPVADAATVTRSPHCRRCKWSAEPLAPAAPPKARRPALRGRQAALQARAAAAVVRVGTAVSPRGGCVSVFCYWHVEATDCGSVRVYRPHPAELMPGARRRTRRLKAGSRRFLAGLASGPPDCSEVNRTLLAPSPLLRQNFRGPVGCTRIDQRIVR